MGFPTSSSIFNGIRAGRVAGGLSEKQLNTIVRYIDRSAIFTRRIGEFEQEGGQIEYEATEKNYFWMNAGVPTVYVSPEYRNRGAKRADIDTLTKVIAHEMSHFETYARHHFNPNSAKDADGAGAEGSRDEARAYGLEYLVFREINATTPRVDWMEKDQAESAQKGIDALPGGAATEATMLEGAMRGLCDWAANWTGPTIDAGGYFQFYKNEWLKIQDPPGDPVKLRDVYMRCDAGGAIHEVEYIQEPGGPRVVVLDPATGEFVSKPA